MGSNVLKWYQIQIIFLAKSCSKCIKCFLFTIVIHTTWLMCWICSWDSVILTMFPESFKFIYRELLFPHEDMFLLLFPECFKIHTLESFHFHTKICFSFFTNQMIKCWRKLFPLFPNQNVVVQFPWAITGCYFQPINPNFNFQ